MKKGTVLVLCVLLAGCGGGSGGGSKVLQDFGIQDRPDDYVSGRDKVMARLDDVGKSEMNRMNLQDRRGEIRYDDSDELHGKYFKVVKKYERYYVMDANTSSRTSRSSERGFVGLVEYTFDYYQGPLRKTRAEAAADIADIAMREGGRETYRYRFNSAAAWTGGKGERVR